MCSDYVNKILCIELDKINYGFLKQDSIDYKLELFGLKNKEFLESLLLFKGMFLLNFAFL